MTDKFRETVSGWDAKTKAIVGVLTLIVTCLILVVTLSSTYGSDTKQLKTNTDGIAVNTSDLKAIKEVTLPSMQSDIAVGKVNDAVMRDELKSLKDQQTQNFNTTMSFLKEMRQELKSEINKKKDK